MSLPGHSVPHLSGQFSLDKLIAHYQRYGGTITMGSGESQFYIVRLPRQNRIHFYAYNWVSGPLVIFRSEGLYDCHSPYWRKEAT